MDSSGSIKGTEFYDEKELVNKMVTDLKVAPDESRVALVLFGSKAFVKVRFGDDRTAETFQDVVHYLPKLEGQTRIDNALRASRKVFQYARQNVYKIAVILTDGDQSVGASSLKQTSKPLRDAGVRVIAVGMGAGIKEGRLRLMTESDEDVVKKNNAKEYLQEILDELNQNGCSKYCGFHPNLVLITTDT